MGRITSRTAIATDAKSSAIAAISCVAPTAAPPTLQIEHHLFPGVSQYHYPALAPIVMATCKEFGVSYRCATCLLAVLACVGVPVPVPYTTYRACIAVTSCSHLALRQSCRYERTFTDALKAHIRHLYALGKEGKAAHID